MIFDLVDLQMTDDDDDDFGGILANRIPTQNLRDLLLNRSFK